MIFPMHVFNKYVIYVDLHTASNEIDEHLIHQSLICNPGVLEAKRHHLVAIYSSIYNERGVLLIMVKHWDLIIPQVCIHKTWELMPDCSVH